MSTVYGPCTQCGSDNCEIEMETFVKVCRDCGGLEKVDGFRRCPHDGGEMKNKQSMVGRNFKVTTYTCTTCAYRTVAESRIVEESVGRIKRGRGVVARFRKLQGGEP